MDRDISEKLASILVGVGIAGVAVSTGLPVPPGMGEALVGGGGMLAIFRDKRKREAEDAVKTVCDAILANWRHWADGIDPGGLDSAHASFIETIPHCAPNPTAIVSAHLDPERIAILMLVIAEGRRPEVYGDTPVNRLNRDFFTAVVRGGYAAMLSQPTLTMKLLPALAQSILGQLGRIEAKTDRQTDLLKEIRDRLAHSPDAPNPRDDLNALPAHSNVAPSADAARAAAKEAMDRNDVAAALQHMREADEIEAAVEADKLKAADAKETEARDARAEAEAQSLSRARTQVAHASLRYAVQDYSGAALLYESAIGRLPPKGATAMRDACRLC